MEPELYNVLALCFVLNELVDELVGLRLPNLLRDLDGLAMIISLVLGPYLRINALWYQEFLLKAACGCTLTHLEAIALPT